MVKQDYSEKYYNYEVIDLSWMEAFRELEVCKQTCERCVDNHIVCTTFVDCCNPHRDCPTRRVVHRLKEKYGMV